jgi:hypothetical protein
MASARPNASSMAWPRRLVDVQVSRQDLCQPRGERVQPVEKRDAAGIRAVRTPSSSDDAGSPRATRGRYASRHRADAGVDPSGPARDGRDERDRESAEASLTFGWNIGGSKVHNLARWVFVLPAALLFPRKHASA